MKTKASLMNRIKLCITLNDHILIKDILESLKAKAEKADENESKYINAMIECVKQFKKNPLAAKYTESQLKKMLLSHYVYEASFSCIFQQIDSKRVNENIEAVVREIYRSIREVYCGGALLKEAEQKLQKVQEQIASIEEEKASIKSINTAGVYLDHGAWHDKLLEQITKQEQWKEMEKEILDWKIAYEVNKNKIEAFVGGLDNDEKKDLFDSVYYHGFPNEKAFALLKRYYLSNNIF